MSEERNKTELEKLELEINKATAEIFKAIGLGLHEFQYAKDPEKTAKRYVGRLIGRIDEASNALEELKGKCLALYRS